MEQQDFINFQKEVLETLRIHRLLINRIYNKELTQIEGDTSASLTNESSQKVN